MDPARAKATELAVELLRGSVPADAVKGALSAPPGDASPPGRGFEDLAAGLASRLGYLVAVTALEIEKHLR